MVRTRGRGGDDLDGLWNDDWHHAAIVALTGRNEAYYSDYMGCPQEFVLRRQGMVIFIKASHTRGRKHLEALPVSI